MNHSSGRALSRLPAGSLKRTLLSAVALAALALSAQAATVAPTTPWVATATAAHDPRAALHVAPMRAGDPVHIVVSLKLRNKGELDTLTKHLISGHGGAKALSAEQFKARHAPTQAQADRVVAYLREQGFTQIQVADNRLLVSAVGGAGVVKNAFKAELHEYDVQGRRAYANVTAAQVPAHLGDTVLGVLGLQTVHLAHTTLQAARPQAVHTLAVTGVNPPDFPFIYEADSLPSATNATIGIITQGSMTQTIADLKTFAANAGYPSPSVTTRTVGAASSDTSGVSEWNLDSQDALAAAGGTIHSMVLYTVATLNDADLSLGYNQAVSDNSARVINVSLGGCENDQGGVEASQDQIFQAAVAQGQTFSVSSGDSGAWECGASAGKAQSYPAVSPYVIAVGGTTLSTNGATWSGETVWACSSASNCQQSGSGGAGGGPSLTESAPSWQTAAGVLSNGKRGVPDISFDASSASGAVITVGNGTQQWGGTSLAAPLFTGFYSRIQSAHGNSLPFPAATLYAGAAAHPEWFHDVTSGSQGYAAGTGWDYATGYGSLRVANFSSAFDDTSGGGGGGGSSGELVANGGFEGTDAPWSLSSGALCTNASCTGETAHGGSGFAWLDGYGAAHTDTAAQSITLPSGAASAALSFYLHVDTKETDSSAYDKLSVQVLNGNGSVLATLATYSNLDAGSGYALKTLDLTPYIGSTVTIKFTGKEDASLATSFILDDVSATAN